MSFDDDQEFDGATIDELAEEDEAEDEDEAVEDDMP